jgi:hypothetical protein
MLGVEVAHGGAKHSPRHAPAQSARNDGALDELEQALHERARAFTKSAATSGPSANSQYDTSQTMNRSTVIESRMMLGGAMGAALRW